MKRLILPICFLLTVLRTLCPPGPTGRRPGAPCSRARPVDWRPALRPPPLVVASATGAVCHLPQRSAAPPCRGTRRWQDARVAERTVLRGARWPGEVAVADGRITAVGAVAAREGDRVLDCAGGLITPGL